MFEDFDARDSKKSDAKDKLLEEFARYLITQSQKKPLPERLQALLDAEWIDGKMDDLLDMDVWNQLDLAKIAAVFLLSLHAPESDDESEET